MAFGERPSKFALSRSPETVADTATGSCCSKALFEFMYTNDYEAAFVEVYEKHADLIELFQDFGFDRVAVNDRGEWAMAKALKPTEEKLDPLEFHVRFGPRHLAAQEADLLIVPVQPRYHQLLFPDAERQLALTAESHPFGNSIRKAYLCHSPKKSITPGSTLLFYRSHDRKAATIVGVAETMLASTDPDAIARFVGRRTVYTYEQIRSMAAQGRVLALLFRQSRILQPDWPLDLLKRSGILRGPPQSITAIPKERSSWVVQQLLQ